VMLAAPVKKLLRINFLRSINFYLENLNVRHPIHVAIDFSFVISIYPFSPTETIPVY
jgi:hypothetical protein